MKHIIFDCDGTLVDTSGTKYQLFEGIQKLLDQHRLECMYYVWTARERGSAIKLLSELGIYSYFDGLFTPSDGPGKPHIHGLKELVGEVVKHSICVVGDSDLDMLGAKNFGVLAIGASWNQLVSEENLVEAGADFIVSHPSQCSKLFELKLKGDTHV